MAGNDQAEATLEQALEDYQKALDINPKFANAANDQGIIRGMLANAVIRRGGDPRPHFEAGQEALDLAFELDPKKVWIPMIRGNLFLDRARWEWSSMPDPSVSSILELIEASRSNFDRGLARHSEDAYAQAARAQTWVLESDLRRDNPVERLHALREALSGFDRALQVDPGCSPCLRDQTDALLKFAQASSNTATQQRILQQAERSLLKAREEDPSDAGTAALGAELHLVRCDLFQSQCGDLLTDGERWVETALNIAPRSQTAQAYRGALHALASNRGVPGASLEIARNSLNEATKNRLSLQRKFARWIALIDQQGLQ